jgi:hypothetical protein
MAREDFSSLVEAWALIVGRTQRGGWPRQVLQIAGVGGETRCVAGSGLMGGSERTANKESVG